ncbi:metalloregulator ArsR/SmtB family transcription factor [Phenylobacterium sp.]|uniref:ArsR/SmtB family transcription factor n=1 Tax=Phenylobacterium sp. TaxID=1871053 RepID=UPI002E359FF6|nr:metalloregulator ArsR/SmtB family transcription factor [Phenylobacterium sp.]HEX4711127.1 metalloregulator ArsR/SmtB family transcription factor [Phenylobacterium sp.]
MTNARTALAALGALGDPSRRAIFEHLGARPSAVNEIAAGMTVGRSAVSQHLKVLKEAGLVSETPDGTRRIYRLDPRGIATLRDWLDSQWALSLEAFAGFADEQMDLEDPE